MDVHRFRLTYLLQCDCKLSSQITQRANLSFAKLPVSIIGVGYSGRGVHHGASVRAVHIGADVRPSGVGAGHGVFGVVRVVQGVDRFHHHGWRVAVGLVENLARIFVMATGDVTSCQRVEGGGEGRQDHAHPAQDVRPAVLPGGAVFQDLSRIKVKQCYF